MGSISDSNRNCMDKENKRGAVNERKRQHERAASQKKRQKTHSAQRARSIMYNFISQRAKGRSFASLQMHGAAAMSEFLT